MAADEFVDVVDVDDRVLRTVTRAEMRAGRLRHRATYVLLFNSRGQLFVHRRTATKDVYPSYKDCAFGGVLAAGEQYDTAARRELEEEAGVFGAALRRIGPLRYDDEDNHVNGMVYSCTFDGPLTLQPEEVAGGEWLDIDQVIERAQREPFCPDGVQALLSYLQRLADVRDA